MRKVACIAFSFLFTCLIYHRPTTAGETTAPGSLQQTVHETIPPMMKEFDIPGVAVAVIVDDKSYYFSYGVASRASESPVTDHTLFEIGSVSKIFTATLAGYAQSSGSLSLSDNATKYLPELASSSFDTIQLLHLGTYTAGGLPLQFPDSVTSTGAMIDYFRNWKPAYEAGTHRMYFQSEHWPVRFPYRQKLALPFPGANGEHHLPGIGHA